MPFCSECGSKLEDGSRFCSECGTPIQGTAQPQPTVQPNYQPPQPMAQSQGEIVQGVIQACKQGIPVSVFTLFLTDHRIVAAKTGGVLSNLATAGVVTGGVLGGLIGAGLDSRRGDKKTQELFQFSPDEMLAKDKKNYEILYANIQSVEMKPPGLLGMGEIKVKTPGKDFKFNLEVSKDVFQQHINVMNHVLSGRIFVK